MAFTDHYIVQLGFVVEPDEVKKNKWWMNMSMSLIVYLRRNVLVNIKLGHAGSPLRQNFNLELIEQIQRIKNLESQFKELTQTMSEKYTDLLLKQICDFKIKCLIKKSRVCCIHTKK